MTNVEKTINRPINKSAKSRAPKVPTKACIKCGRVRKVDDFYINKDWGEQLGRDAWCKECVGRCMNQEDVKEYCWENHRKYTDRAWETARRRAEKLAATNSSYTHASEERREYILERLTAQNFPAVMPAYYQYVDTEKDTSALSYAEAKEQGKTVQEEDPNLRTYSTEFNGWFSPRDLDYLEGYYKRLEEDFTFDDESTRDYARKVCKASLQADKAQDAYMLGKIDYDVVKDSLAQFDMLSKSANFAACKRKPGDTSGLTSFAELTLKLETSGYPMTRKIEWEKDDVDRTIDEFRHIVEAVGLEDV